MKLPLTYATFACLAKRRSSLQQMRFQAAWFTFFPGMLSLPASGMNFRDVPNLLKFEHHARGHSDNEIVMDCYRRIREVITPVPQPPIGDLKASCEAVEKSTRLLWACAAATDNIVPRLWDYLPDYESSLAYFLDLNDLELMAVTKLHHLAWEQHARA
jgi:hypothetical protein